MACKPSESFKRSLRQKRGEPEMQLMSEPEPTCLQVLCALLNERKPGGYFDSPIIEAVWAKIQECFPGEFLMHVFPGNEEECSQATGDIFATDFPMGYCIRETHSCTANGSIIGSYSTKLIYPVNSAITPCPECNEEASVDCCECDCGCGCEGGDMANCDDLVAALNNIYASNIAVSENLDAIREQQICMLEFMRQALPDRNFYPKVAEGVQRAILTSSDNIAQQINHHTTIVTGTETPSSQVEPVNIIDQTDLLPFEPCTSTTFCPPGQHRDEETGECVDDEEEGGGEPLP